MLIKIPPRQEQILKKYPKRAHPNLLTYNALVLGGRRGFQQTCP
jgi:hypothetical protein